jgi:hypothetical protein
MSDNRISGDDAPHAETSESNFAADARQHADSMADAVKDHARETADVGKAQLADRIEGVAGAVHRSGEQLEGHQDFLAKLVQRSADEIGSLAGTLRANDLDGLTERLQNLARRQPAVFTGLSIAAGFAAVRIAKVAVSRASSDGASQPMEVEHE